MSDALTVVVLSPMAGGFYYGGVLSGIAREVSAAGGRVVLVQTVEAGLSNEQFPGVPAFDAATSWDVASGFISLASAAPAAYLAQLADIGKPMVLAGNVVPGVHAPSVTSDNAGGVRAAVQHLIEHGHTKIGFLGNLEQFDTLERHAAYLETLDRQGLPRRPELEFIAQDNTEDGSRLSAPAVAAATAAGKMTAVFAATDRNALGLMDALHQFGIRFGRDLAVIGFDNIALSRRSEPPLSTVNQEFYRVGKLAGQLLLAQIRGEFVPTIRHTTPATLIMRESCGCEGTRAVEVTPAATAQTQGLERGLRGRVADLIGTSRHLGAEAVASVGSVVDDVVRLLQDAASGGEAAPSAELESAATRLFAPKQDTSTAASIVGAFADYGRAVLEGMAPDAPHRTAVQERVAAMALAFLSAQADSHSLRAMIDESTMREQYETGVRLLRRDAGDPRNLGWLGNSAVSGACLALWDRPSGGGQLAIAGVYDPTSRLAHLLGLRTTAQCFPPRELLGLSGAADEDVIFVLPVKARGQDWGLLAIAGGIDAKFMIGRETLNHWAALLSVAFEQEALLGSVRRSEERYALAAQAANDGLWDWDIATNTVYYAPRWSAMLGYAPADTAPTPQAWFGIVHADDLSTLSAALDDALSGGAGSIEVEHRVRTAAGDYRWMLCRATAVTDDTGSTSRMVGSLTDIDDRTSLEEQLRYGALHDALTGLPNRALLLDRLSWAIDSARRRSGAQFAVLFLDLDGFKVVNDSLGHHIGDRLLVEVGTRLRSSLRAVDTAARVGGDEFVLLLMDIEPNDVHELVKKVQARLAEPFDLDGHQVVVTASIGIATSRSDYVSADDVLRDADIAMYRAKAGERGSYELFDAGMHARAVKRLQTEVELRRAFDLGEFRVDYQPIVDLMTTRTLGFEALIRWNHPRSGLVLPDDFLPVAEETGLILGLGHWIIDETCRQIAQWRQTYTGNIAVSVNVSNREFWHGGLLE
ncbi:MAG: diguanylate cyclase, partial [Mycobacteriales bacterium]